MATIKVWFDGKALVPLEPVDLPVGPEVIIEIKEVDQPKPGTGEAMRALVRYLHTRPPLPTDLIEEFNRGLEQCNTPADYKRCFDDIYDTLPE